MARKNFSFQRIAFLVVSIASLALILCNSSLAIEYMNRGMKLCVATVIPSLFPFMVASELIVASGAARLIGRFLRAPSRFLFGIGGEGASALLLGAICGFPVGTRAAVSLYRLGSLSEDELSRIVCFSNNPSSAFVISAVGLSIFGSHAFGITLFCVTLISSALVGIVLKLLSHKSPTSAPIFKNPFTESENESMGLSRFASCVANAATSMLSVCAFVIFFSALTGTLSHTLEALSVPNSLRALFIAFFELSGGVSAASCVRPTELAVLIAAFAVGWSGISVHLQLLGICAGLRISYVRYFLSKLAQGIINALLIYLLLPLFESSLSFGAESVGRFDSYLSVSGGGYLSVAITSAFFCAIALALVRRVKRNVI